MVGAGGQVIDVNAITCVASGQPLTIRGYDKGSDDGRNPSLQQTKCIIRNKIYNDEGTDNGRDPSLPAKERERERQREILTQ